MHRELVPDLGAMRSLIRPFKLFMNASVIGYYGNNVGILGKQETHLLCVLRCRQSKIISKNLLPEQHQKTGAKHYVYRNEATP